ncbi:MAG: CHAD domain-containing protein [Bacteriovorax sp.]|nr:CHAD domain-containing protein [Bacteriovorax sp.]
MDSKIKIKIKRKTIYSCLVEALEQNGAKYIQLLKSDRKKLSVETVHQIRVTTRKLEACLELLDSLRIGHKKLTKDLQYVRKIHGPLRNIHVELESIKNIEDQVKAKAFKCFLKKHEKKCEKKLFSELDLISFEKQNIEIQKIKNNLLLKDTPAMNEKAFNAMEAQNLKLFLEFKKTKRAFSPNTPKSIHPIRIAAKKLRYQGEILRPAISFENIDLPQLKHLQETFGKIQNDNVLHKSIDKFLHKHSKKGLKSVIKLQDLVSREQHTLMALVSKMKVMSVPKTNR